MDDERGDLQPSSLDRTNSVRQSVRESLGKNRDRIYDNIIVLLIYWENGEDCYKSEAESLKDFFHEHFGYPVCQFPIPDEKPDTQLQQRISTLTLSVKSSRSLTIIHYGGHGDSDTVAERRRAVWAAKDQRGPTLNWSDIQPNLKHIEGDVLLILDCCFAAQCLRDADRVLPPNVELLAACAMKLQTIKSGERTFTSLWKKVVLQLLRKREMVVMKRVVECLCHRDTNAVETPIHETPAWPRQSICLEPLSKQRDDKSYKYPEAAISLQVLLRSPLKDQVLQNFLYWLGKVTPREVLDIDVTELAERTTKMKNFVDRTTRGTSDTYPSIEFPDGSKADIIQAWSDFVVKIEKKVAALKAMSKTDLQHPLGEHLPEVDVEELLHNFVGDVYQLQGIIERRLLWLPELYDQDVLKQKLPELGGIGMTNAFQVRLQTLVEPESTFFKAEPSSRIPIGDNVLSGLISEEHPELGFVMIEYSAFRKDDPKFNDSLIRDRMNRLSKVLSTASVGEFRTAKCLGCISDQKRDRYGLVFENPQGRSVEPISLYTILGPDAKRAKLAQRPTLGEKFNLASKIGQALLKWHCVGWVHQGIASYNVIFLKNVETKKVDYSKPYLYGFEHSREASGYSARLPDQYDDIRDVYRHPERQGWYPQGTHHKRHDIYSFGVLLFEIGLWIQLAPGLQNRIKRNGHGSLAGYFREQVKGKLSADMGVPYERATEMCLSGDLGVIEDNDCQTNLARAFEAKVMTRIGIGASVDRDPLESSS